MFQEWREKGNEAVFSEPKGEKKKEKKDYSYKGRESKSFLSYIGEGLHESLIHFAS